MQQLGISQPIAMVLVAQALADAQEVRLTKPVLGPEDRIGAFNFVRNELMCRKRQMTATDRFHVDKVLALLQKWARKERRELEKREARR